MSKIKWVIDPAHSQISFKVRHLMISTVTGHFKTFSVEAETETEDFTTASKILFTAQVNSIDTDNANRDNHLKSADFFDAANYPQLKFVGTKYESNKNGDKIYGNLTIRDTTKPVVFTIEHGGIVMDPYGQRKTGFTVTGEISRKEFGLIWNDVTEAGHVVVADEIKIQAEVQLVRVVPTSPLAATTLA